MSKTTKNLFDKVGWRLHRLNPEQTFYLITNSTFWRKTLFNYGKSKIEDENKKMNYENKTNNST